MSAITMDMSRGARFGLTALRLLTAAMLGLLVLCTTIGGASAELSQHDYVVNCKESGGTPTRDGPRQARCTIGKWTQVCDFHTNPPKCKMTATVLDPHFAVDVEGVAQTDPEPANPHSGVGGGIFVQAEPQPTEPAGSDVIATTDQPVLWQADPAQSPPDAGDAAVMTTTDTVIAKPETEPGSEDAGTGSTTFVATDGGFSAPSDVE